MGRKRKKGMGNERQYGRKQSTGKISTESNSTCAYRPWACKSAKQMGRVAQILNPHESGNCFEPGSSPGKDLNWALRNLRAE